MSTSVKRFLQRSTIKCFLGDHGIAHPLHITSLQNVHLASGLRVQHRCGPFNLYGSLSTFILNPIRAPSIGLYRTSSKTGVCSYYCSMRYTWAYSISYTAYMAVYCNLF